MIWLWRHGGKRLFDFLLALFGLIFFALPMVWIAWRITAESGKPVLFNQIRVGHRGKRFLVYKFRSMTNEEVTPFGATLRTRAMDELPQLFNILRGDMSFVGPRPIIPEELAELDKTPNGEKRLWIRPGLTGLAQLHSKKVPSLPERVAWDTAYVERCSPRLDVWLLFKSVGITLNHAWDDPKSNNTLKGS